MMKIKNVAKVFLFAFCLVVSPLLWADNGPESQPANTVIGQQDTRCPESNNSYTPEVAMPQPLDSDEEQDLNPAPSQTVQEAGP